MAELADALDLKPGDLGREGSTPSRGICRCGGFGRRTGLKTRRPSGHEGSIPSFGSFLLAASPLL